MKQMRKLLLAASAVAMLASCSKSEDSTSPVIDKQIKATSAIEGATTKAVIGTDAALSDLTFLRLDDASTQTTFDFTTATAITSCSRAVGGVITFGTAQNYDRADDKTAYMRGFTTANAMVTPATKVIWTIDGATDILLTDVWNAGNYVTPIETGMAFKRQLSRIEVVCKGEENIHNDVTHDVWGNVKAIKVVGAKPELTFDYATNAVSNTGAAADLSLLKGTEYDATKTFEEKRILAATAADEVFGSAMIYPLSSSIKLKVTTAGKSEEIEREITISDLPAMERAKIHKITLTFSTDGKTISATNSTIEAWGDGTPGTGTVPTTK